MKEKYYSNPEARSNRKEKEIATTIIKAMENVISDINTLKDDLKKLKAKPDDFSVNKILNVASTQLRINKNKSKKLDKEYFNVIIKNCEHDFKYDSESYGGNFDIYVCTKCGMIEYRK